MCYGFGLKESELNGASLQFVSLFIQGQINRQNTFVRSGWEQARFVASTMSKQAGKMKFPWERQYLSIRDVDPEIFKRLTPDFDGKPLTDKDIPTQWR